MRISGSVWAGVLAAVLPTTMALAQQSAPEIRAQVVPHDFTTLAAEISARIESMPIHEGGQFTKGELLVSFDCALQKAQLDEAKADLRAAQLTEATDQRLLALKSIGKLEDGLADASVDKNRARLAAAAAVVSKCTIVAPYNGRVVEQKSRAQQFVQPGQALLDIINDSVLELDFVVPSRWLTWLVVGYRFDVAIDDDGKTYPVKLSRIGARIDPVSQTIKMIGTIEGHPAGLLAGMSGRVLLTAPASAAAPHQLRPRLNGS